MKIGRKEEVKPKLALNFQRSIRKIVAIILTLVLSLNISILSVNASNTSTNSIKNPFKDLSSKHWAYEDILKAISKGYVTGTTSTTFEPDKVMTEPELIALLVRVFSDFNSQPQEKLRRAVDELADIYRTTGALFPENKIYADHQNSWWIEEYFYFTENLKMWDANLDCQEIPCTRYRMATLMWNLVCAYGRGFSLGDEELARSIINDYDKVKEHCDADSKSGYLTLMGVLGCCKGSYMQGIDSKGTFAGDMAVTRAQAVTLIMRFDDELEQTDVDWPYDETAVDAFDCFIGSGGANLINHSSEAKPLWIGVPLKGADEVEFTITCDPFTKLDFHFFGTEQPRVVHTTENLPGYENVGGISIDTNYKMSHAYMMEQCSAERPGQTMTVKWITVAYDYITIFAGFYNPETDEVECPPHAQWWLNDIRLIYY